MSRLPVRGSSVDALIGVWRGLPILQRGLDYEGYMTVQCPHTSVQGPAVVILMVHFKLQIFWLRTFSYVVNYLILLLGNKKYPEIYILHCRYSGCGPCPRGQRSLASLCSPCTAPPLLYDWWAAYILVFHPLMKQIFLSFDFTKYTKPCITQNQNI